MRETLKAAHLGDVKVRVLHFALAVELDGDLAVAFKPRYGIDGNGLGHRISPKSAGEDARTTAGPETGATSGSKTRERRNIQRLTGYQRGQRRMKSVGRGRTAG